MSNRLARMDPSNAACTTSIWSPASRMMNRMSSTALPKETFRSAPSVSPSFVATASVAWASMPASGMMAMAFMAKIISGLRPAAWTAMPMGTKINSKLTQL